MNRRQIHASWASRLFAKAFALILVAVFLVLLIGAEKFAVQRLAGPTINTITDLIVSLFKPIGDHAAVVILDGKDPVIDAAWPLDYSRWERTALTAWCAGARVLVFDLSFARPGEVMAGGKDTREHFAATLAMLSGTRDDAGTAAQREALFQRRCAPQLADEETAKQIGRKSATTMPVIIAPVAGGYHEPELREIWADVDWDGSGNYWARGNDRSTVGFLAAQDWCHAGGGAVGCATIDAPPPAIVLRDTLTTPFEQTHYSFPDSHESPVSLPPCVYRDDKQPWGLVARAMWWAAVATMVNGPSREWNTCPPVLKLSNSQIETPGKPLAETLGGRIVFVGAADLSGFRDTVDTTLHTGLPGVFVHALAADALLGGSPRVPLPADWVMLLGLLPLLWTALVVRALFGVRLKSWEFLRHPGVAAMLLSLIAICICAACVALSFPLLPVLGWALIVFITLGGESFDPVEIISNCLKFMRNYLFGVAEREIHYQERRNMDVKGKKMG